MLQLAYQNLSGYWRHRHSGSTIETACPARTNSMCRARASPAAGRCASLLPLRLRRSSGRLRPQQNRWGGSTTTKRWKGHCRPCRTGAMGRGRPTRHAQLHHPADTAGSGRVDSHRPGGADRPDPLPEEAGSYDIVGVTCNGFAVTHVDALCHIFTPGGKHGMYNGFSIDNVTDVGATKLGIEHVAATRIVGRGGLLDVAKVRADRFRWAPRSCRRIWMLQRHSTA